MNGLDSKLSGHTGPIASVSSEALTRFPSVRSTYFYQGSPIHMDCKIKSTRRGPWHVSALHNYFYDHLNQYVFQRELPSAAFAFFARCKLAFDQLFNQEDSIQFAKSIMGSGRIRSGVTWQARLGRFGSLRDALNKGMPLMADLTIYYETDEELDMEKYLQETSWGRCHHLRNIRFVRGLSPEARRPELKPGKIVFSSGDRLFFSSASLVREKYALANLVLRLVYYFSGAIALPRMDLGMKIVGIDANKEGTVFVTVFGSDGRFLDRFSRTAPQKGELRDAETFKKIMYKLEDWVDENEEFVIHFDGKLTGPLCELLPWLEKFFPRATLVELPKYEQPLMARLVNNEYAGPAMEGDFVVFDDNTGAVCLNAQWAETQCPRGLFARKIMGELSLAAVLEQLYNLAKADPFSLFHTPSLPISIRFCADHPDLALDAIKMHDRYWDEVFGERPSGNEHFPEVAAP